MFWTLLRKELAYQVLSGRLLVSLALFLLLIPLSSILLLEQRERQLTELAPYEEANNGFWKYLAKQTDPNKRFDAYAGFGVRVARTPPTLAFVARGLDAAMPRFLVAAVKSGQSQYQLTSLETEKPNAAALDNPILARLPVADTVTIVGVIGALLAIFVSFDAVCREREEGTLKLLFANPLRRATVMLAKWTAAVVSVGLGLVTATLVVAAYVVAARKVVLTGEVLGSWGALTALGVVYLGFFCAAGVLVSTVARSRRVSLMVGLLVWLLLALVLPGMTKVVAESAVPLPMKPRIRVLWKEYNDGLQGKRDAPVMRDIKQLVAEDDERVRLIETHERKAEEQRRLFESLSMVSPLASYLYGSAELAGTGLTYYDAFRRADERLATDFRAFVNKHRPGARAQELKAEDVELGKLPTFAGASPGARAPLVFAAKQAAVLCLEVLGVLVAGMFLFIRTAEL